MVASPYPMAERAAAAWQCLNPINSCRDRSVLLWQECSPSMDRLVMMSLLVQDRVFFQMLMSL